MNKLAFTKIKNMKIQTKQFNFFIIGKYLTFVLIISFNYSCKKENTILDSCLGKIEELDNRNSCKTKAKENNDYFFETCRIDYVGDYKLLEESKEFAPQYCSDLGTIFSYSSDSGEAKDFELTRKAYFKSSPVVTNHKISCEDSRDDIGHCFETETIAMTLSEVNGPSDFIIVIEIVIVIKSDGIEEVADILRIYRYPDREILDSKSELAAIINERTLTSDYFRIKEEQEFYNTIEIQNNTYLGVFSMDISNSVNSEYKIYYNAEVGLLAFQDIEGAIWKLLN